MSVAGKNRSPTKQCANAFDAGTQATVIASATRRRVVKNMTMPPVSLDNREHRPASRRDAGDHQRICM
jgi:hypothetical protein